MDGYEHADENLNRAVKQVFGGNDHENFVLYNASVYTPWENFYGGLSVCAGIIDRVFKGGLPNSLAHKEARLLDCHGKSILPGFIDLHVHGAKGFDFTVASVDEITRAASYHAYTGGTTTLLPTLVSAPLKHIKEAAARIGQAKNRTCGPKIIGVHLEGPFFNPWYKGAHPEEYLINPEPALVKDLAGSIGENLAMVTLSPEIPHALEAITYLSRRGVVGALGHSGATVEEVQAAVDCGLRHAVHTYSAMRRFHHRSPGVLGAVLTMDEISAEIIADGVHTHPAAVKLFFRAKPYDKTVLATDALAVCGMPGTTLQLGGKTIINAGGKAFLEDGTLAGSILTMNRAVAGAVRMTGLSLETILPSATINPAKVLDIDYCTGSLETGKDADLVIMDADYNVLLTMCRGKPLWHQGAS